MWGEAQPSVELWVDDHQGYEPGVVTGNLRHARLPLDPHPGDYLVVGDDEVLPALALVVSREANGTLRLRIQIRFPRSTGKSCDGVRSVDSTTD